MILPAPLMAAAMPLPYAIDAAISATPRFHSPIAFAIIDATPFHVAITPYHYCHFRRHFTLPCRHAITLPLLMLRRR
jgi:hypothetical protein